VGSRELEKGELRLSEPVAGSSEKSFIQGSFGLIGAEALTARITRARRQIRCAIMQRRNEPRSGVSIKDASRAEKRNA
jgi:hypothetical protein